MIIRGTIETVKTGVVEYIEVETQDYAAGYAQMLRGIPEGKRLLNVRVNKE